MKMRINKLAALALVGALAVTTLGGCTSATTIADSSSATEEKTLDTVNSSEASDADIDETASDADIDETTSDADIDGTTSDVDIDETASDTDNTEKSSDVDSTENISDEDTTSVLTAHEIADQMYFGWNLGNTLDAYNGQARQLRNDGLKTETVWGNPKTTQAIIDTVKDTGINVIRIPVTWYTHMDPNTYEIDSEWMARVREVVDYAIDDDTFVIINMHHDTGTNGWLHASENNLDWKKEVFAKAWDQIAREFMDYDNHLLFEGYNELLDENNEWNNPEVRDIYVGNDLNQIFVDTVRSTGGNNAERVLIVNTYAAALNNRVVKNFNLPKDTAEDRLMAEVHPYTPYDFTAPEHPEVKNWDPAAVDNAFKEIHTKFAITRTPIIVGEFGATPKGNDPEREAWAKYFVERAASDGIPCCWWDNGILNEFGIIDRKGLCVANEKLLNIMLEAAKSK